MDCNGLCLTPGDIGLSGAGVAYAHPSCPEHGQPHPFELGTADRLGRLLCACGCYQADHPDQLTSNLLRLEAFRESVGGYHERAAELYRTAAIVELAEVFGHDQEPAEHPEEDR